jgi:hypothetical protein
VDAIAGASLLPKGMKLEALEDMRGKTVLITGALPVAVGQWGFSILLISPKCIAHWLACAGGVMMMMMMMMI